MLAAGKGDRPNPCSISSFRPIMAPYKLFLSLTAALAFSSPVDAFIHSPATRSRTALPTSDDISIVQRSPVAHHANTRSRSSPSILSMARNEVQGNDRFISCLPYLLPLMDGDRYGRYIFALLPPLGLADSLLLGPFKFGALA